jgi:hypothetical protein
MQGLLPSDIEGWFNLLWKLVGALAALWALVVAFIRRPLIDKINGLGSRVKGLEAKCGEHEGQIEQLMRSDERQNFQYAAVGERMGRLEGKQEQLEIAVNEGMAEIRDRLGNIEGQLSFIARAVSPPPRQ